MPRKEFHRYLQRLAQSFKNLQYVIEGEIPGAGNLTAEQLNANEQTSSGVLSKMAQIISTY